MTRRWFNHFSKITLLLLIDFAYSNLYVTGGVGAKSFTDNLQYTLNVLRDINGGETVFESRSQIGYMSSNLKRFNYFAELGYLTYRRIWLFWQYPNGSEVILLSLNCPLMHMHLEGSVQCSVLLTRPTYMYMVQLSMDSMKHFLLLHISIW